MNNLEDKQRNMDIKIRPIRPEDAFSVSEVFYKTWLQTYPNKDLRITKKDIQEKFKDYLNEESINKFKEAILNLNRDHSVWVAEYKTKTIGVCRVIKRKDFNQLQAIYVLPEYQNQGIGKKLWDVTLDFFNDYKDIVVHVVTYNKQAISFYQKLGFKDTGKRFTEERHKIRNVYLPEMEMVFRKNKKFKNSSTR